MLYLCHFPQSLFEVVDRVENDIPCCSIAWEPQLSHGQQHPEGQEVEESLKDVATRGVKSIDFLVMEYGDIFPPHASLEVLIAKLIATGVVGESEGEVSLAMNLIMYLAAIGLTDLQLDTTLGQVCS